MKIVNVKKRLVDKLVDECNETIDEEVKPAITPVENSYMHNSCTVYIVLFPIFLTIIVIGAYFAPYKYRNRSKKNVSKYYQITIYETYKMGKIKQVSIKNRTYYFYNDQINLKDFDASVLKIDKKNYKEIDVYYIGCVIFKEITNCNNINSVNPLYLMIDKMIGHFKEKRGNKYLLLDDVNENKEV